MSIPAEDVRSWFAAEEEYIYDYDLVYLDKGSAIEFDSIPAGYNLKVVDSNTDRNYDSYGYSVLEDGYIIFSVTDPDGNSQNFKLPVDYASYEGWTYYLDRIAPAVHKQKVVTMWEWVS